MKMAIKKTNIHFKFIISIIDSKFWPPPWFVNEEFHRASQWPEDGFSPISTRGFGYKKVVHTTVQVRLER